MRSPLGRARALLRDLAATHEALDRLEARLAPIAVAVREEELLAGPTAEDVDRLAEDVHHLVARALARADRARPDPTEVD